MAIREQDSSLAVENKPALVDTQVRPRRRLPAGWTVSDFVDWADRNGIKYVVLRWFESLPEIVDDDDLDILVADDHIEQVLSIIEKKSTVGIACDVYSVSGRMGTKYKGVPYYPPHLAREILDSSQLHRGSIPVPDTQRYFYSLAYHAVYHKGRRSDLSKQGEEKRESSAATSKHSHFDKLCALRDELRLGVSIDFDSLANFLHEHSWEPGLDLLRKLGESNGWARELYKKRASSRQPIDGLGVFILRNWAVRKGWAPHVLVRLQKAGFVIIMVQELMGDRQSRAHAYLRGGNWGSSREFPVNSGGPAMLIAVFDPDPKPVAEGDRKQYPHMSNGRIIEIKREIRAMMNKGREPDALVNSLHTSDDESEAVYYLELIVPETLPQVRKITAQIDGPLNRRVERFVRKLTPRRVARRLRRTARGLRA